MLWEGIRLYSREQYAKLPPSVRFILTKDVQKYLHPDIPDKYLNKSLLLIQNGDSFEILVEGENFLVIDDYVDGFVVIGRWEAQRVYRDDMRECQNRGQSLIATLYQSEQEALIRKITNTETAAKKPTQSGGLIGILRRGLTGPPAKTSRKSSSSVNVTTGAGTRRLPRGTPVVTTTRTRNRTADTEPETARKRPAARTQTKPTSQRKTTSTRTTASIRAASAGSTARKTAASASTKTTARRTAAGTTAQKKTASTRTTAQRKTTSTRTAASTRTATKTAEKKPAAKTSTRTTAQKKTTSTRTAASTRTASKRAEKKTTATKTKETSKKTSAKKDTKSTTRTRQGRK